MLSLLVDPEQNIIFGNTGDDTFILSENSDIQIHGGIGYDTVNLNGNNEAYTLSNLEFVEEINGSNYNEAIDVSSNMINLTINLNDGNDSIYS